MLTKNKIRPFANAEELVECASSTIRYPTYCVKPILQTIPSLAIKPPMPFMPAKPCIKLQPPEVQKPVPKVVPINTISISHIVKETSPMRRQYIGQGRLDIDLQTVRQCLCISHEVLPPSNFVGRHTFYDRSPRKTLYGGEFQAPKWIGEEGTVRCKNIAQSMNATTVTSGKEQIKKIMATNLHSLSEQ